MAKSKEINIPFPEEMNALRWIDRKPDLREFFDLLPTIEDDLSVSNICQCAPDANPLFDDFRDDIICEILREFLTRGVRYSNLVHFAREVPTVYPWSKTYDRYRQNVNRRFVVYPWMIVFVETEAQITFALQWSLRYNIPICTRSGAHCFEPYSLINGMIIDQSSRKGITVDPEDSDRSSERHATIEAGVLLGPMAVELEKYGLVAVAGTCPNNGFSGFTLGGGIGLLLRRYGLGSDNVVAFRIALATGEIIDVNESAHSNLYWALRGGGLGNYGIVTSFQVKVYPIIQVITFELDYPLDFLPQIGSQWQEWAPKTDPRLSSEMYAFPNAVKISGMFLGQKEECLTLLEPVLKYADQSIVEEKTYVEAARQFAGTGYWPPFFKNKSGFVRKPLPKKAFDIIVEFMSHAAPNNRLEFGAFGGKVSSIPSDATAFVHRKVLFWLHFQCKWYRQEEQTRQIEWVRSFYCAIKPFMNGQCYQNIADSDLKYPLEVYYGKNLPRLIEVKTKYDPHNVFRYQQSIPPAN